MNARILLVVVALSLIGTASARGDEQCGDGYYGAGDPRVPYTICTPWPKPTWEEWQAGWHYIPPTWGIGSLPVRLAPANTTTGYGVEICYLGITDTTDERYQRRCIGISAPTVPFSYWCQQLRLLETPTMRIPWFELEGQCGTPPALTQVTQTFRRGRLFRVR